MEFIGKHNGQVSTYIPDFAWISHALPLKRKRKLLKLTKDFFLYTFEVIPYTNDWTIEDMAYSTPY